MQIGKVHCVTSPGGEGRVCEAWSLRERPCRRIATRVLVLPSPSEAICDRSYGVGQGVSRRSPACREFHGIASRDLVSQLDSQEHLTV